MQAFLTQAFGTQSLANLGRLALPLCLLPYDPTMKNENGKCGAGAGGALVRFAVLLLL